MMRFIGGSAVVRGGHGRGKCARLEMLAPDNMTFETDSADRGARMDHDCG